VAREVDRAVDVDRQIGVDLDQAAEITLVPVIATPRLVGDVLDREPLVGRERDVLHRAVAAGLDGGLEDGIELVARDDEWPSPRVVACGERPLAREALVQRIEKLLKVRRRVRRGDRVVERLRLFVERQLLALEDPDTRVE
jgi:hypothetical protein